MANYTVPSGVTSDSLTIQAGTMTVMNGGMATNTRLNNKGKLIVEAGGEADDTIINSGGSANVQYGGIMDRVTVSAGASISIASDGSALNITEDGGIVTWNAGAIVSFLPNEFKDYDYTGNISATVHSGTTATRTTLNNAADLYVYNGGLAQDTDLKTKSILHVSSGGRATNTRVNSSGKLEVYSSGLADGVTVSAGASLSIESDGSALNIKEDGGVVTWSAGAVVSFLKNEFVDYEYTGNISATVHSGTTATRTTLNNAADLYVFKGGLAREADVKTKSILHVSSGGTAVDARINSTGKLRLYSGGLASNVIVSSGASLFISSGGKVTGKMDIIYGANFSASAGAIIDFDISELSGGNEVRLSNLSYVKGAPVYTLTVSGSQASGVYSLAGGASGFTGSITVKDTSGDTLGTLTVGNSIVTEGTVYALSVGPAAQGSVLTLSVFPNEPPIVTNVKANITAQTTQPVTVTAEFSDDVQLLSTLYRVGEKDTWKEYINGVTVKQNATIYFKAIDIAGVESEEASYVVNNIEIIPDTTLPTVKNVKADITAQTYQPVTVTADFADDVELAYSLYKVGDGEWKNYVDGVTVAQNSTIYFKAIDAAGNESLIVPYEVKNIKQLIPLPDLYFYAPSEWYSGIVIAPDENRATEQTLWDYEKLYLSFAVANDGTEDAGPFSVETYVDGDYYCTIPYRNGMQSDKYQAYSYLSIGSFAAGTHSLSFNILTDEEDLYPEDNSLDWTFTVKDSGLGSFYDIYYGGNTSKLNDYTTLHLDTGVYVFSGNFIGSEAGRKVNAKIVIYNSNYKKVGTVKVKKGKVQYKQFVLSSDTYKVEVISTDKNKTADKITLTINGNVFYKKDLYDNSINDVAQTRPYIATVRGTATTIISNGWVGFGDVLSCRQINFEYSGRYTFTVKSSDRVKISLISVITDSKGRTKEKTVVSKTISGKKTIGKEIDFGGVLLNDGTYYLRVQALKATKGTNADYSVRVSERSTFFTRSDNNWNDFVYNKKTATLNSNLKSFVTTELKSNTKEILLDKDSSEGEWDNFVGYEDPVDCAKIVLGSDAKLSFILTATDATKFVIYQLKPGKKLGTYTLKKLQTTKLKKVKGSNIYKADTKLLSLAEGEYYISMESTNAKKGGNASYNVELNKAVSSGLPDAGFALAESGMDMTGAGFDSGTEKLFGTETGGLLASL